MHKKKKKKWKKTSQNVGFNAKRVFFKYTNYVFKNIKLLVLKSCIKIPGRVLPSDNNGILGKQWGLFFVYILLCKICHVKYIYIYNANQHIWHFNYFYLTELLLKNLSDNNKIYRKTICSFPICLGVLSRAWWALSTDLPFSSHTIETTETRETVLVRVTAGELRRYFCFRQTSHGKINKVDTL